MGNNPHKADESAVGTINRSLRGFGTARRGRLIVSTADNEN
ncbi:MAG TPA: hypothetical protein VJ761_02440 [Ktedonobacteraceae bacterium]|nr:hypothetical protein [Ktedonobacteraceae bacterium]